MNQELFSILMGHPEVAGIQIGDQVSDEVNHPKHYAESKIETIEAIEAWGLGFHLGNAVKYISRAGKKDKAKEVQDLEKAIWYIRRQIELIKNPEPCKPNDMNKGV